LGHRGSEASPSSIYEVNLSGLGFQRF